ncbi:MAG: AraC family transcriptional regulator [Spirochaetia bacterium]|nr:AraC family transcriptional regulator [Spirochaetia bacterium]
MPVSDLAKMSWNLVDNLLADGRSSCFDILLPSHPVIRRSCGCLYSLGDIEQARLRVGNKQLFLSWLIQSFAVNEAGQEQLKTLLSLLEEDDERAVLSLLERLVYQFFDSGGDPNLLSEALHWYTTFYATACMTEYLGAQIRDLFLRLRDLVACEHAYALAQQAKVLNALKCDLLGVRELEAIARVLNAHLPFLKIDEGYLVLHEDDQQSLFIGGYTSSNVLSDRQYFAKQLLLPSVYLEQLRHGVYVIEPLFMDSQPLGYLVVRTALFDGSIMEELRTALSSAIKGAFLLDAANRAREEAEREQRARSEFFANISEGLKGPLESIVSLLSEQNKNLQQRVNKEVLTAQHLLDLSFSYTKEFCLEPQIIEISSLLQVLADSCDCIDPLPVVFADPEKLKQSLQIICEHIRKEGTSVHITTSLQVEGLMVSFCSSLHTYKATLGRQDLSLALAQRILLMSGAMVLFEDNAILVRLPWPSLHGLSSSSPGKEAVYILSEGETAAPGLFSAFTGIRCIKASDFGKKDNVVHQENVLLYDGRRKAVDLQLVLHHLINHLQFSSLAFVGYHIPNGYASLATALTAAKEKELAKGVLVLCGSLNKALLGKIGLADNALECTENELPAILAQQQVNLVVSDVPNPKLYELIRKTSMVPLVLIRESWTAEDVQALSSLPRLVLVHRCVEESFEFLARILDLYYRQEVLPPLTGVLVKRALVYLEAHAKSSISRWQLAEQVNVSEDYLTRIFHKEIGLSPWEYLNRYRIHLAVLLLKQSTLTINEIASQTGFQDQAYFCRVFRKIKGCAPSTVRMND